MFRSVFSFSRVVVTRSINSDDRHLIRFVSPSRCERHRCSFLRLGDSDVPVQGKQIQAPARFASLLADDGNAPMELFDSLFV
jgi:hypothetical protein